jgi:hypothetical protein
MPRLVISVSMVDDQNRPMVNQRWSPLSYEDFNNPALFDNSPDGLNETERNLLERIRTAIDRSLLRFARGERRRFEPRVVREEVQFDEFLGRIEIDQVDEPSDSPRMVLMSPPLSPGERAELIRSVIPKEDEPLRRPEPKRLSRYERKPVI